MAVSTICRGTKFQTEQLSYNESKGGYIPTRIPKNSGQVTYVVRNRSTGAYYTVWYDDAIKGFKLGAIISGNSPSNGQLVSICYEI